VLPSIGPIDRAEETFLSEAFLIRKETFSAAHHYRVPGMSQREAESLYGPLSTHGHNYVLELTIRGPVSERTGMVENLKSMKDALRESAIQELDRAFLNEDVEQFRTVAPTLENLSGYIWGRLATIYSEGRLHRIRLAEDDTLYVEREAGRKKVYLTRAYHFCAAHRLHEPELTDEENRNLFGKCNNPSGHGHNYNLEVTVAGEVNEKTGTVCNVGELDRVVDERVVEYLDHMHLNVDIDEFRSVNPTAENIARVIWNRLGSDLGGARLHRVRLYETERNMAEYYGD
jgi:6-pyruvoyltetrahydropterin/6-carboxytetrahydropterin synthase